MGELVEQCARLPAQRGGWGARKWLRAVSDSSSFIPNVLGSYHVQTIVLQVHLEVEKSKDMKHPQDSFLQCILRTFIFIEMEAGDSSSTL